MSEKCYKTHPPLKIGEWEVHGGRAFEPSKAAGRDLLIALDKFASGPSPYRPWSEGSVEAYVYDMPDMGTPSDADDFKKFVVWLAGKVREGRRIHVGCMGGHGRTGMVLSALYHELTQDKDAIAKVRAGYCNRAVETGSQIKWLGEHFGLTPVKAAKSLFVDEGAYIPDVLKSKIPATKGFLSKYNRSFFGSGEPPMAYRIDPMNKSLCIWSI